MTIQGTIVNGAVVLDAPAPVPDGTRVEIMVAAAEEVAAAPTLAFMLELAGSIKDLPSDFAAQHDHYIHGTPKRKPRE